jgi:hypothetical protein
MGCPVNDKRTCGAIVPGQCYCPRSGVEPLPELCQHCKDDDPARNTYLLEHPVNGASVRALRSRAVQPNPPAAVPCN